MNFGRTRSAVTLFGPAIAGAGMQFVALVLMTLLFYVLSRTRFFSLEWPFTICGEDAACRTATPLVRVSYLMTAVGMALTNNRIMARAISWARHASNATRPNGATFLAEAVAVQSSIVMIACIVQELETPSPIVVAFGQWIGGIWLGATLWPAMWSILVAAFGSLVHALFLSVRQT